MKANPFHYELKNLATIMAMRTIIRVIPAIIRIISIWLAWKFPIDRIMHAQLRAELAVKRVKSEVL